MTSAYKMKSVWPSWIYNRKLSIRAQGCEIPATKTVRKISAFFDILRYTKY